ncbi:uncharacterized protein LOC130447437 [Diorhabda sublineata]|uniref:uncharacterized protein LOC130447437 n=1 Tax=Diorhabda sublineata TaxID=1163346 RepID=UPI0024E15AC5|nr:uncharacterized protein LOC130447437 [Diorhabda sublineata]
MMATVSHEINDLLNTIPDYIQKVKCDTNKFTAPFKCAVKSCPNKFEKFDENSFSLYKFHKFPVNKKLRKLWKLKCGLQKYDHVKGLMVCSVHFNLDDYIRNYKEEFNNPNFKRQLSSSAVPKLKLGPNQYKNFDISDSDYDTDMDNYQDIAQSTNSKNQVLESDIVLKNGPLDLNEVRREVDLNKELEETSRGLENELKSCENKLNAINKSIRTARVKAIHLKKRNRAEDDILRNIFSNAQINLLLGKKAVWSNDDLATAFTIRHMGSKKCYLYMKNVLKIPLPSLSCVQKWAATQAQSM